MGARPSSKKFSYEEEHTHIKGRGLIASSALGLVDGLITNLSFLTGFAAAADLSLVRFAGLAAMLAGTVSMFFGGLLEARSELDLFRADSKREAYEIKNERDEEIAELKALYIQKGLTGEEATMVVKRISSRDDKFLDDLLANELHIHRENLENPYRRGAVIGMAFLSGALVPLVPYYLIGIKQEALVASVILSFVFLFSAGAWKGNIVGRSPLKSGLETLLIGAAGAAILYVIGTFLGFV